METSEIHDYENAFIRRESLLWDAGGEIFFQ